MEEMSRGAAMQAQCVHIMHIAAGAAEQQILLASCLCSSCKHEGQAEGEGLLTWPRTGLGGLGLGRGGPTEGFWGGLGYSDAMMRSCTHPSHGW